MILIAEAPALLINLPIIISLIAVSRYIIGFKTWKTYPTIALTLAYYLIFLTVGSLVTTTLLWALFSTIMIGAAIGMRNVVRKLKINYYARIAAMYLGATIASLLIIGILGKTVLGVYTSDLLFGIALFLIGSTTDDLATLLFKKDGQEFTRRMLTTIVISLLGGLLLSWPWWNDVLSRHHEILILVLLADTAAAFWTSVRFTELLRFGSIIRNQR